MRKTILLFSAIAIVGFSCKKNRSCVCNDPGGETVVFTTRDTKDNAEQQCKDYYDSNFGNITWSETSCQIK